MKPLVFFLLALQGQASFAQDTTGVKVPFEGMDLGWINGQNRQSHFPLLLKDKATDETILSGVAFLDAYYNYDFNRPLDNTHTISSSIGRSNEFTVNQISLGLETSYRNMIGRIWLQYGQMASIVQDVDGSVSHGRHTSINNLKYIREASAGYHFNKWYGVNVELGIFMSYIGLESYVLNENWSYQRSMPCDMTPFYFSGARIQVFPSARLKTEFWLLNGWQSYNAWNQGLGFGSSTYWRPTDNAQLVANFYLAGHDTRNAPGTLRFHHDHSIVGRYHKNRLSRGLSMAAFSINNHYGFQEGGTVDRNKNYMLGTSLANRFWFRQDHLGVTLRADYVTNPGGYLLFSPSPVTDNAFSGAIAAGESLEMWQATATLDLMPNDHFTFRLEYGYRRSNIPYFAGRSGTTSPDGWIDTPIVSWVPDLQKKERRLTVAVSFRL